MSTSTVRRRLGWFGAPVVVGGLVAVSVSLAGASTPASDHSKLASTTGSSKAIGTLYARTELYFGSNRPKGAPVNSAQFHRFLDSTITPRFPDGLTELTGEGQWLGKTGPVEEKSFVVILLYPLDDKHASDRIEQIRRAYKRHFQQESVLRDDSRDSVSF